MRALLLVLAAVSLVAGFAAEHDTMGKNGEGVQEEPIRNHDVRKMNEHCADGKWLVDDWMVLGWGENSCWFIKKNSSKKEKGVGIWIPFIHFDMEKLGAKKETCQEYLNNCLATEPSIFECAVNAIGLCNLW